MSNEDNYREKPPDNNVSHSFVFDILYMGSCFEETECYVKASFYNNTTQKLTAPDSLTIYGI